jgi:uncharacterized Zn finger protein (UPF0148 family)
MVRPRIHCPSCKSSQAYIRIKTGDVVCPKCGYAGPLKANAPAPKQRDQHVA